MNKKSELLTLFMITSFLILMGGVYYYGEKLEPVNYIGNQITGQIYNIQSKNPNCNFENIRIPHNQVKKFKTLEEARNQGFNKSSICP